MLKIRMLRIGKKNQPSFKIVVTPKTNPPRGGRFVEEVGFYNPLKHEKVINKERIRFWLGKGALPSDTVHNLLIKEGVIQAKKRPLHKKSKEKDEAKPSVPPPVQAKREKTPVKAAEAEGEGKGGVSVQGKELAEAQNKESIAEDKK